MDQKRQYWPHRNQSRVSVCSLLPLRRPIQIAATLRIPRCSIPIQDSHTELRETQPRRILPDRICSDHCGRQTPLATEMSPVLHWIPPAIHRCAWRSGPPESSVPHAAARISECCGGNGRAFLCLCGAFCYSPSRNSRLRRESDGTADQRNTGPSGISVGRPLSPAPPTKAVLPFVCTSHRSPALASDRWLAPTKAENPAF